MPPFLAMIIPVSDGRPDNSLPQPQPPGGVVSPPIYHPPGIWPSPGHPDNSLPQPPPGIWPSPGHPAHPIYPGTPPGIWGGGNVPMPTPPIELPPDLPTPPELPPGAVWPPQAVVVWVPGQGYKVFPTSNKPTPHS